MKRKKKKINYNRVILVTISLIVISFIIYTETTKIFSNKYKLRYLDYETKDINYILKNFNSKDINKIIDDKRQKEIVAFINRKYFISTNLFKYIDYKEKNMKFKLDEVISIVNTKADIDDYENVEKADISLNEAILVNKHNKLDEKYIPDLVDASLLYSYNGIKINKIMLNDLEEMVRDAKKEDVNPILIKGYVSYDSLKNIYDNIKKTSSDEYADLVALRPAYSEFQTGLAINILSKNISYKTFENTKLDKWLLENSSKYGFIQRYPKDKEYITTMKPIPYQYRYVGKDAAKKMKEENLCLEEYIAFYKSKKNI